MVKMCHRTGPDGRIVEYPCPDTLIFKYVNGFKIEIDGANPELAAELAKSLDGSASFHATCANQGLAYVVEGLSKTKAIEILAPLSPENSATKTADFLESLPDNIPTPFDLR